MKVLFAGTPETAVTALEGLLTSPHEIVGVLTREDAPQGRKRVLTPSPVARRAEELGLPIIKANRWSLEVQEQVQALKPQVAAVVAYGTILPQSALDTLEHGWVNLHFSNLPLWRGAAPVQRALMAGEDEIFSCTFLIEAGLDTGPVFMQESTRVQGDDTAADILHRLALSGGALLSQTFEKIEQKIAPQPQHGRPTHAAKLDVSDGKITWSDTTAEIISRCRGVIPEPGAWCMLEQNRIKIAMVRPSLESPAGEYGTVRVLAKKVVVSCSDGCVELTQVQPAGKKMMNAADWARGLGKALNEQKVVLS
ncbi:methionyl-tRNA formyltransferase [Rothia sp. P7181]|uniref:methionyl-tRNA formyltransferase n=1 Tax=Rothia sp. P7181 TaxID=3402663 RepID=UPI003AE2D039